MSSATITGASWIVQNISAVVPLLTDMEVNGTAGQMVITHKSTFQHPVGLQYSITQALQGHLGIHFYPNTGMISWQV